MSRHRKPHYLYGNHIISTDSLGTPQNYSTYFVKLWEAGILDGPLADRLQDMARFRNVLVHLYAEVRAETVREILNEDLDDIRTFIKQVYEYLDADE